MNLISRAAGTGALRPDTDSNDVRHLAAAIAWVDGQLPPDPDRRARLVQTVLDGIRPH
jgi:hypothetical protein